MSEEFELMNIIDKHRNDYDPEGLWRVFNVMSG